MNIRQVLARVATTISCIAMDDDAENEFVRGGAIPPLVEALRKHGSDSNLAEAVARALRNLSAQSRHKPIVIAAGTVSAAVLSLFQPQVCEAPSAITPLAELLTLLCNYEAGSARTELRASSRSGICELIECYGKLSSEDGVASHNALRELVAALDRES